MGRDPPLPVLDRPVIVPKGFIHHAKVSIPPDLEISRECTGNLATRTIDRPIADHFSVQMGLEVEIREAVFVILGLLRKEAGVVLV